MNEQPETPEGWKREGPYLHRQYGEKAATLQFNIEAGWTCVVYAPKEKPRIMSGWREYPSAEAWANKQLGVPKPVEVVEEKFADGSYVFKDTENTRWATVSKVLGRWYVGTTDQGRGFDTEDEACEKAREYVRGVQ